MQVPFKRSKHGIALKVKVEPKSSRRGISGLIGDSLKVSGENSVDLSLNNVSQRTQISTIILTGL